MKKVFPLILTIFLLGCSKEHKFYYDSGELLNSYTTVNGKKEGKSITYLKNGKIEGYKLYRNGKLNGVSRIFYDDGALKEQSNYRDDDLLEQHRYTIDGKIALEFLPPKARMYFYSEKMSHFEVEYLTADTSQSWKTNSNGMNSSNTFKFDSLEIFRSNDDTTRILTYYGIDRETSVAKRLVADETRIDTVKNSFIHQYRDSLKILF